MDEEKTIREEINLLLEKLGVLAEAEVSKNNEIFSVNIKSEESGLLIGYHGETLTALQLILSLLVQKKLGKFIPLIVNVGDYREKREEKLKQLAFEGARRAKETKQEVALDNLSSWQRRIVHMALSDDKDVSTESRGEEPERQLVIKPR